MAPLKEWLTPPRRLLLLLVLLTFASICTLIFFGLQLLRQQRTVEAQRSRERLEQMADRITAIARGNLAESTEKLAAGIATPGDLLFKLTPNSLDAEPSGQLLYYPFAPPDPELDSNFFGEGELFEFAESQPAEALAAFDHLSQSKNAEIRAAALVRKARVLRNIGRTEESVLAYQNLAAMDANVAGVPAALLAQHAICELSHSIQKALELRKDLSSGRWRLTRAQFNFYWSEANRMAGTRGPLPADKRRLTEIADFVWIDRVNHPDARGQEIAWIDDAPILLIWRGTSEERQVLAARPDSFVPASASMAGVQYAFVDNQGRVLSGVRKSSGHSVVRTAAETQLPWTLLVSEMAQTAEGDISAQRRFLLLGLLVMMGFLVLGTYFIARAIHREAEIQRMQSHFVSSVSHEFRSPLTSMRQLSEMLALGRVASEERRQLYYETLVHETTRLQRLIEGLLNFGRMEAGARRYRFEELDPFALIQGVVGELSPQIASAGKQIEAIRTCGPCWIEADAEALSVALRNLLDNAVKYSPDQPTVWVECGLDESKVAIRVTDKGLGIPDSERRRIFHRFIRGSAAIAANVKGSGVGLAMVSHIVTAHGGEITVESELGQGSTFTMLFPALERV